MWVGWMDEYLRSGFITQITTEGWLVLGWNPAMSNRVIKMMSKMVAEEWLRGGGEVEGDDRRWQINVEMGWDGI